MSERIHQVKLWGQLKQLTGEDTVNVADASSVDDLIIKLSEQKSEISHLLLSGEKPSSSILVFINDTQHARGSDVELAANDSITIMSPIAGG